MLRRKGRVDLAKSVDEIRKGYFTKKTSQENEIGFFFISRKHYT